MTRAAAGQRTVSPTHWIVAGTLVGLAVVAVPPARADAACPWLTRLAEIHEGAQPRGFAGTAPLSRAPAHRAARPRAAVDDSGVWVRLPAALRDGRPGTRL
jgi:hypothetical protein